MIETDKIKTISANGILLSFLTVFLILIAGLSLLGKSADYDNYMTMVVDKTEMVGGANEVAFKCIVKINDIFFNSNFQTFLVIFAIIGVSLKIYALFRFSKIPLLSYFLYVFSYFILHEYVQIRAGVATGIFLLAIIDLANGDLKKYFIKSFIAIMFHWSSVILVPLYFVVRHLKVQIFYFLPFIGVIFYFNGLNLHAFLGDLLGPVEILFNYYQTHAGHVEEVNAFNFITISQVGIFLVCAILLSRKKEVDAFDFTMFKIFSISLFLFFMLSSFGLPVIAFRVSEYLNVVLLLLIPAVVSFFREKFFLSMLLVFYYFLYLFHLIVNTQVIPAVLIFFRSL